MTPLWQWQAHLKTTRLYQKSHSYIWSKFKFKFKWNSNSTGNSNANSSHSNSKHQWTLKKWVFKLKKKKRNNAPGNNQLTSQLGSSTPHFFQTRAAMHSSARLPNTTIKTITTDAEHWWTFQNGHTFVIVVTLSSSCLSLFHSLFRLLNVGMSRITWQGTTHPIRSCDTTTRAYSCPISLLQSFVPFVSSLRAAHLKRPLSFAYTRQDKLKLVTCG